MIKPTDKQLREAIDSVFQIYDKDRSNSLEFYEVKDIITDTFRSSNNNRHITDEDVKRFVGEVDQNSDGKITREELFTIFKRLIENHYKSDD